MVDVLGSGFTLAHGGFHNELDQPHTEMSVYVDAAIYGYGRMIMCHMLADTVEELHDMADKIGVARKWYQGPPKSSTPHYDICKSKRALAVQFGAIECTREEIVAVRYRVLKRLRGEMRAVVTLKKISSAARAGRSKGAGPARKS